MPRKKMDPEDCGADNLAPSTGTDTSASVDLEIRLPPRLRRCQANLQQALASVQRSLSVNLQVSSSPVPQLVAPSGSILNNITGTFNNGTYPSSGLQTRWTPSLVSHTRGRYYEKRFAQREPINKAKEMVFKNTLITADVKINFPLEGAHATFPSDLAFHLSEIYQWPSSCVMVIVTHHVILLNNMTDPAYHITLSALPTEIGPAKNKRSAHMIQHFIAQNLGIPMDRGVLTFLALAEGNMATKGMTTLQEIEDYEPETSSQDGSMSKGKDKPQGSFKNMNIDADDRAASATPKSPSRVHSDRKAVTDEEFDGKSTEQAKAPKVKPRKSVMSLFRF